MPWVDGKVRPLDAFLQTERLIFRPITESDLDDLVALDADPEVLRWINGGVATPRDVLQREILPRFMRVYHRLGGPGYWAAIERSSGDFLGWFCLHPEDGEDPDVLALGYRLRRAVWGKGYATEGARALIRKAFTELGARRVFATTYERNTGSRRVMEKAGMRLVRTYRPTPEELAAGGTFVSTPGEVWEGEDVEYAIDKPEWDATGEHIDGLAGTDSPR